MDRAGLISDESIHYLDHLAPFCSLHNYPLIILDPSIAELARRFYPDVIILEQADPHAFEIVACEPKALLSPALSSLWLPHGNSDKGWHSPFFESLQPGETAFVYGQKMSDFIRAKTQGVHLIPVGNFRLVYFQKHRPFYEKLLSELSFPQDKVRFLYAPTWDDIEKNSSFWTALPLLAASTPDWAALIVKCHPNTYRQYPERIEQLRGRYPHLLFLEEFPPIYPLLSVCDAYIGDMSSIGYDFLAFDNPMFFINSQHRPLSAPSTYLYQCGHVFSPSQIPSLFSLYNPTETTFSSLRKQIYSYTFS